MLVMNANTGIGKFYPTKFVKSGLTITTITVYLFSSLICYLFSSQLICSNPALFIPVGTTREQLGFALCLQVPIFVVVTKIDVCRPSVLEKNLSNMEQLLKSPGSSKLPLRVRTESDAVNAATKMTCDK